MKARGFIHEVISPSTGNKLTVVVFVFGAKKLCGNGRNSQIQKTVYYELVIKKTAGRAHIIC